MDFTKDFFRFNIYDFTILFQEYFLPNLMSNLFTHIHCKMGLMSHNFLIWMNVVPLCKCSEAVA